MPAVIATHALTKRYGKTRGIESLDLEVAAGEVFGFLGPNGAGKTTTIRTLLDLLHPTSGRAEIFGLDSHRDSVAIRARLGNLPGDFACPAYMTGRELLRYVGELRGIDAVARAIPLAERFEANLDRRVGELSRGNRQKVGLIQALVHDPELLVLDEPTGGLDPLMQEEFLKVVAERRAAGRTVFLSSHDLDEVARACDRVGIIRDGRLVTVERVAEMRERTDHTVTVRFADEPDLAALAAVAGVSDVRRDDGAFHLRVQGTPDPLIAFLAGHRVADLEVTHPTLEELFLTYYDREGAA